jgi:hypothetical protein
MSLIRFSQPLFIAFFLLPIASANALTGAGSSQMPFTFVENKGQADARIRYIGNGPEFKAWFEDRGVVLQQGRAAVKIAFEGGGAPVITPEQATGARANYLRGSNPADWRTDLPLFGAVHYAGVWPGIDLTYSAEQTRVKAEYLVAPGASVERIRLRFDGEARIQRDGTLRIEGTSGNFLEEKPTLYQSIGGERKEVTGGFRQLARGVIGFWASGYDHAEPLVIDPAILFSGYFGGSSQESITAVRIDSSNNIVVAGWTSSTDLPTANGARKKSGGGVDAFVASFLPTGGTLIYCTYLGGSGDDRAFGLTTDAARSVYITGWTSSANFPVLGAIQTRLGGTRDAFVAKLNATGNALIYSTYLGGSAVDVGNAITVDATGAAIVVGDSTSSNLPVTSQAFQAKFGGSQDAFVAKLSPAGSALTLMTYMGGSGVDHASSVVLGGVGNILLGGYTWSINFPTLLPYQAKSGGGQDGFVAKMYPDGSKLFYSTYLGGYGGSIGAVEQVNAVCVDAAGVTTVAGTTSSANFPATPGALQTIFGGQTDGFVTRLTNKGMVLQSTFLGGAMGDGINALAIDFHGQPYVTGFTASQDFPVQRPLQNTNAGALDAFAVKFNNSLSAVFGTYLGGSGSESGNAIAVDLETSMVVAGQTASGDFPVLGNLQNALPDLLCSFITKIAPSFTLALEGSSAFFFDRWQTLNYLTTSAFGNGKATDIPVVGDWDGSGKRRLGVFRNGTWYLDINGDQLLGAGDKTIQFGQAGDVPIVGDWTGTGRTFLGLFRNGTVILDLSGHITGIPTGQSDATFPFGQGGDVPVAADWNGSGTTKIGVFRNGLWLVDYNGDRVFNSLDRSYTYGQPGDIPVTGDWDSSGSRSKIGVYRAGLWILDYDGDNVLTTLYTNEMVLGFGDSTYIPVVF